jgi:hypothetical protein
MAAFSSGLLGDILARLLIVPLGAIAVAWSVGVFPTFWSQMPIIEVGAHVLAGESYKLEILDTLERRLDQAQTSIISSALPTNVAAIIRQRRAEDAIASGNQQLIDVKLDALRATIGGALSYAPEDPYLWFVLFWLDSTRNGLTRENLGYLRMSYELGPYEAWIALKRNRAVLKIFPQLPVDIAEAAISEYLGFLRSQGLFAEAADILAGPGWPIRHILLARLKDLKEADRRLFAKELHNKDLDDVPVPGIELPPPRPWRH